MNKLFRNTIKNGKKVFYETSIIDIHNKGDDMIAEISDELNIDGNEINEIVKDADEDDKFKNKDNNYSKTLENLDKSVLI